MTRGTRDAAGFANRRGQPPAQCASCSKISLRRFSLRIYVGFGPFTVSGTNALAGSASPRAMARASCALWISSFPRLMSLSFPGPAGVSSPFSLRLTCMHPPQRAGPWRVHFVRPRTGSLSCPWHRRTGKRPARRHHRNSEWSDTHRSCPTAAWMAKLARPSGSGHYVAGERFVGKCIHDGIRFFLFQPEKCRCPDNRVPASRTGMLSGFRRIVLRFLQC